MFMQLGIKQNEEQL